MIIILRNDMQQFIAFPLHVSYCCLKMGSLQFGTKGARGGLCILKIGFLDRYFIICIELMIFIESRHN